MQIDYLKEEINVWESRYNEMESRNEEMKGTVGDLYHRVFSL